MYPTLRWTNGMNDIAMSARKTRPGETIEHLFSNAFFFFFPQVFTRNS
jgi:hypothetical protein